MPPIEGISATDQIFGTPAGSGSQELGKDAFMTLLIAQLQHQDPLQPTSNSEFIAQGVTVRVNSHGLRGPEFETAKAPGRKRILILGDSVVFGWGAEEQDLFPAELQRRFDGDGRGIEVIAAGVGSWNTRAEYEFLREVGVDLPALTGPGSELVYAASWFMGNSFPGTMISGAGGR